MSHLGGLAGCAGLAWETDWRLRDWDRWWAPVLAAAAAAAATCCLLLLCRQFSPADVPPRDGEREGLARGRLWIRSWEEVLRWSTGWSVPWTKRRRSVEKRLGMGSGMGLTKLREGPQGTVHG
ncbi:hypothetical protein F5Y01DRAFT_311956 [Xylaria sp. FL0043]|nr:hypothetical protein F5Y01DRAFT_311956 [Xylaria sp. FL0043]